ncbi:hypothetical protein [Novosphingobium sp. ERW19]|uniref:hypothetical protein n=1 Tax=Novosphingobium sp. ERW19 TaxID=2726186 RepID=UPI001456EC7D|nr:hypothetical protein [Novosphingobium sp. ERW19]NLR38533.1 hypothetical protein [Novosphingobium sp. ERW19]
MDTLIFGQPLSDWLLGIGFVLAITGAIQFMASFVVVKFVGLQSPPIRRAVLTAASAYALCSGFLIFGGASEYAIWVPLVSIPAAIGVYHYWKAGFLRAWYDDPSQIPEGVGIANQDWRVGLYAVAGAAIILMVKKAPLIFAVQNSTSP